MLNHLATVKLPFAEQQFVFQEMVNVISEAGARLERYDAQLPRTVAGRRFAPVVRALMSLRGLARKENPAEKNHRKKKT